MQLAISAFIMLHSSEGVLKHNDITDATLTIEGGFDKRLKENVENLEELKDLTEKERVSNKIRFILSCSTAERNALLSKCLCHLHTKG
ncbi:hypothetical protein RJT34_13441 [Clitoria ternatea]|uniref:Uncharacterized protein n=1 Tax=Clitoria ternatea TaxID=43366 RepID=A0AAN9JQM9_CLITE